MSDADRNDLGGDAEGAAKRPMSADPGVRDTSATGGLDPLAQGGGSTGGIAAGGGLGGAAAGTTMGEARQGGAESLGATGSDLAGAGAPTPDQRPSTDVQRDAAALRGDADDLGRQADVRPDSELGRMGPGGSGVGNTVAPQGYVGGSDRGGR